MSEQPADTCPTCGANGTGHCATATGRDHPRRHRAPITRREWELRQVAGEMLEDALLANVIAVAKLHGWRTAHFRPAQTRHGWRTAVQGDGKGFPDLVLTHVGASRLVVAELKAQRGTVTPEQAAWLEAFDRVAHATAAAVHPLMRPPVEVHIWRPMDYLAGDVDTALRVSPADRAAALR